jgi:hypothetical protein
MPLIAWFLSSLLIVICSSSIISKLTLVGIQKECFPSILDKNYLYSLVISGSIDLLDEKLISCKIFSEQIEFLCYPLLNFISDLSLVISLDDPNANGSYKDGLESILNISNPFPLSNQIFLISFLTIHANFYCPNPDETLLESMMEKLKLQIVQKINTNQRLSPPPFSEYQQIIENMSCAQEREADKMKDIKEVDFYFIKEILLYAKRNFIQMNTESGSMKFLIGYVHYKDLCKFYSFKFPNTYYFVENKLEHFKKFTKFSFKDPTLYEIAEASKIFLVGQIYLPFLVIPLNTFSENFTTCFICHLVRTFHMLKWYELKRITLLGTKNLDTNIDKTLLSCIRLITGINTIAFADSNPSFNIFIKRCKDLLDEIEKIPYQLSKFEYRIDQEPDKTDLIPRIPNWLINRLCDEFVIKSNELNQFLSLYSTLLFVRWTGLMIGMSVEYNQSKFCKDLFKIYEKKTWLLTLSPHLEYYEIFGKMGASSVIPMINFDSPYEYFYNKLVHLLFVKDQIGPELCKKLFVNISSELKLYLEGEGKMSKLDKKIDLEKAFSALYISTTELKFPIQIPGTKKKLTDQK